MSIFRAATNQSAFLKCGILGFQGSGKTYTAVDIAIGFHKHLKADKPVMFLDTETGSDWAIPRFTSAGIELQVAKSRAFRDLVNGIGEAEKGASILIVDSVSHYWGELIDAYKKGHGIRGRIPFHHWMPIKQEWKRFSDAFVNSKLHIVVCGRAAWDYDYEEDSEGHKDLIKTGTKMRAEGEFGYEPSLVLEMERVKETETLDGKPVGKIGARIIHRCHVLKDRHMDGSSLDGAAFDNPTFKCFLPHIKALNLGGEHLGVDTTSTSEDMFEPEGESYQRVRERKTILMEEINGTLDAEFPGSTQANRIARAAIKKHFFGTYSDTKIGTLSESRLADGLAGIQEILPETAKVQEIIDAQKAKGKDAD